MKTVKNVFSIIAMVYCIVCAVTCGILAIVFFAGAGTAETIKQLIVENSPELDAEMVDMLLAAILAGGGIGCLLGMGIGIAGAILAGKNRKTESKGIAIGNIVIGALGAGALNIVAGILAVILASKKTSAESGETPAE